MSDLVKVFFVVSTRDYNTGKIDFSLGDNLSELPRGARRVFGTGHYNQDLVLGRLKKCQDGTWFTEQRQERLAREREDVRYRKKLHKQYLRDLKRTHA